MGRGSRNLSGGGCSGGSFFSFASPIGCGFVADQRARADLHGGRSPSLALHFVKHVFADAVQRAEYADRHRERRPTDGRRLDADTRIRFAVPCRLDRLRVRLFRRSGLPLASSAVCAGFFPVISPRAIAVASVKLYGRRYSRVVLYVTRRGSGALQTTNRKSVFLEFLEFFENFGISGIESGRPFQ